VGNANVDVIAFVDRHPSAGERVEARRLERAPGGAASNFAVAAARLGAHAILLGCVGLDEEGEWLLDRLRGSGVDVSMVSRVSAPTGVALVVVDAGGERTMVVHRGANALLPQVLRERPLPPADWVHAASVPPDLAAEVFASAKRAGAITSYDPGGTVARLGFEGLRSALELTDVLLVNEAEARALAGPRGVGGLAPTVVVKLGARGAVAWVGGREYGAEGFRVEVVDTTGAGDVFDAAFALGVLRGLSPGEALTFANACAALKITRVGGQASPSLEEVARLLRERGYGALALKLAGNL